MCGKITFGSEYTPPERFGTVHNVPISITLSDHLLHPQTSVIPYPYGTMSMFIPLDLDIHPKLTKTDCRALTPKHICLFSNQIFLNSFSDLWNVHPSLLAPMTFCAQKLRFD